MKSRLRRQLLAVTSVLVAGSALAWFTMSSLSSDLVYYWSPTELLEKGDTAVGATVRVMGVVDEGSVDWQPEKQTLSFRVTDGEHTVSIEGTGAPPQMFREGIGVVVEGKLGSDGVFRSTDVLVKHSNEYKPPEDGTHPSDVYRTLENGES